MQRRTFLGAAALGVWGILDRRAIAETGSSTPAKPAPGKDPVEDAFQLPGGIRLRTDQVKDFQELRSRYEPQLREALKKVESLTKPGEKDTAAREVFKLRKEIREYIEAILTKPDPNPPQPPKNKKKKNKKKRKR
jgi:hypothetical protein